MALPLNCRMPSPLWRSTRFLKSPGEGRGVRDAVAGSGVAGDFEEKSASASSLLPFTSNDLRRTISQGKDSYLCCGGAMDWGFYGRVDELWTLAQIIRRNRWYFA
jgi:hypothetical protein